MHQGGIRNMLKYWIPAYAGMTEQQQGISGYAKGRNPASPLYKRETEKNSPADCRANCSEKTYNLLHVAQVFDSSSYS